MAEQTTPRHIFYRDLQSLGFDVFQFSENSGLVANAVDAGDQDLHVKLRNADYETTIYDSNTDCFDDFFKKISQSLDGEKVVFQKNGRCNTFHTVELGNRRIEEQRVQSAPANITVVVYENNQPIRTIEKRISETGFIQKYMTDEKLLVSIIRDLTPAGISIIINDRYNCKLAEFTSENAAKIYLEKLLNDPSRPKISPEQTGWLIKFPNIKPIRIYTDPNAYKEESAMVYAVIQNLVNLYQNAPILLEKYLIGNDDPNQDYLGIYLISFSSFGNDPVVTAEQMNLMRLGHGFTVGDGTGHSSLTARLLV